MNPTELFPQLLAHSRHPMNTVAAGCPASMPSVRQKCHSVGKCTNRKDPGASGWPRLHHDPRRGSRHPRVMSPAPCLLGGWRAVLRAWWGYGAHTPGLPGPLILDLHCHRQGSSEAGHNATLQGLAETSPPQPRFTSVQSRVKSLVWP